jgi:cell division septation protein DedD
LAAHPEDDAFHEIQLNTKQLAFLFMAATVVSVVIFLCGVLVGRGVRAEHATAEAAGLGAAPPSEVRPSAPASATTAPAGSDPTLAAPPPGVDDLSYAKRLGQDRQPVEALTPAARREPVVPPAPPPAAKNAAEKAVGKPADKTPEKSPDKALAQAPKTEPKVLAQGHEPAAVSPPSSKPAGKGYVVQVAALNVRSEADAIAKRLESKGYSVFVLPPSDGAPTIYRVRVGTYKTKREAESIAAKLHKEERVKPWVTR